MSLCLTHRQFWAVCMIMIYLSVAYRNGSKFQAKFTATYSFL